MHRSAPSAPLEGVLQWFKQIHKVHECPTRIHTTRWDVLGVLQWTRMAGHCSAICWPWTEFELTGHSTQMRSFIRLQFQVGSWNRTIDTWTKSILGVSHRTLPRQTCVDTKAATEFALTSTCHRGWTARCGPTSSEGCEACEACEAARSSSLALPGSQMLSDSVSGGSGA
jgi:hypothetical protein